MIPYTDLVRQIWLHHNAYSVCVSDTNIYCVSEKFITWRFPPRNTTNRCFVQCIDRCFLLNFQVYYFKSVETIVDDWINSWSNGCIPNNERFVPVESSHFCAFTMKVSQKMVSQGNVLIQPPLMDDWIEHNTQNPIKIIFHRDEQRAVWSIHFSWLIQFDWNQSNSMPISFVSLWVGNTKLKALLGQWD